MKTAVITGGTRGIGKATVVQFVNNGWRVVFCYKNSSDEACEIGKTYPAAVPFRADVSSEQDVISLFDFSLKELGHIDAVICNAAISDKRLFTDTSADNWNRVFDTNVLGTFLCCREAAKIMIKQKSGSIVTLSSVLGEVGGSCETAYSASKSAIIGLTKSLAKELGPSNIRVNCVSPGVIDTDMNSNLSENDLKDLSDSTSLCRLGTPDEVASAILFLADDRSKYITGNVLSVNGGLII